MPDNSIFLKHLAVAYETQGRMDEAAALIKKAGRAN